MIYQVIDFIDTKIRDGDVGLNARIDAVNAAYNTELPRVDEILTWDQSKLPSQFKHNTVLVVWEGLRDWELISQGKWNSSWLVSIQWFHKENTSRWASKNTTLIASALRSFVDYVAEEDTDPQILEIMDAQMQAAGWVQGNIRWRWVSASMRIKERDENPIIVNDP